MSRRENLKRLLRPRHVAYVGGRTREPAIRMCVEAGFAGPVWPVNPRHETLAGLPCYKSVADLPEPPDATFIAVPHEATIEVVGELAAMGAGGAACYAAGFGEMGTNEGETLQQRLIEAAGDLALVGPNCYGILNALDDAMLWPVRHGWHSLEHGAALVAQSGNICLNIAFNQRSVPFAYVISTGNQAVLGLGDYIDALLDDPRVNAIGVYIEAISDVELFSRAAARALMEGVPIVALKAGASEAGGKLTLSHTGSLAGSDAAYQALFDRLGIVRARSPAELVEFLKILSTGPALEGNRLAVFTCSGGESALVADYAERAGLELPPLSPEQAAKLGEILPAFAHVGNPLDYNTSLWGNRRELEKIFTIMMSEGYDAGLLVIDHLGGTAADKGFVNATDALIAAYHATSTKAVQACSLSESITGEDRGRLINGGVAPLQGIDVAVSAIAAAAELGARRGALARPGVYQGLALPAPTPAPADPRLLDEHESKCLLAEHGLAVPEGRVASARDAPAAARAIGFPVALKLLSPVIAHKSEAGALRLGLAGEAEVAAAASEMAAEFADARLLVEAMIGDPVCELIVGVERDPHLGLMLLMGAGGILVELMEDVATLLLPTDREAIAGALAGLRTAKLFDGFRGQPAADVDAAIDAILSITRFAEANRERLVELDVNPLIVRARGHGAVAADALIRMSTE